MCYKWLVAGTIGSQSLSLYTELLSWALNSTKDTLIHLPSLPNVILANVQIHTVILW